MAPPALGLASSFWHGRRREKAGARGQRAHILVPLEDITNVHSRHTGDKVSDGVLTSGAIDLQCAATSEGAQEQEYLSDIVDVFFAKEGRALPSKYFMEGHPNVSNHKRAILIDWLVELHRAYRLRRETLFLAINLLDRYMSKATVLSTRLQLVGLVSLFVAAKFEEVKPPAVQRLARMTAGAFSKDDILNFECVFLAKLDFEISVPTAAHFLDYMGRAAGVSKTAIELAFYSLELALLDARCSHHEPSALAAAALQVSAEMRGDHGQACHWPQQFATIARRAPSSLRIPASDLRAELVAPPFASLAAVRVKYSSKDHLEVATLMVAVAKNRRRRL